MPRRSKRQQGLAPSAEGSHPAAAPLSPASQQAPVTFADADLEASDPGDGEFSLQDAIESEEDAGVSL